MLKSQTEAGSVPGVRANSSPGAEQQKLVDAHFQSHVAQWREIYEEAGVEGTIFQERLAIVLRWVDELAIALGKRILEIGVGAGMSAVALAQRGYLVVAVDSVEEMLKSTRQHAARAGASSSVFTILGDAHSLAFLEGAFDLVVAVGLIPYLHSPKKALREMARVLKPGGFLMVTAGNRSRLNHVLDPWLCPALEPARSLARAILRRSRGLRSEHIWLPLRLDSLREFEGWLSSVGLVKVKAKTLGFLPLTFNRRRVFGKRSSTSLNRWLQWLADKNVPGVRSSGMDYIVLARKKRDLAD